MTHPEPVPLPTTRERRWIAPAALATVLALFLLASPLELPLYEQYIELADGTWVIERTERAFLLTTGWWESGMLLPLVAWVAGLSCVVAVLTARRRLLVATLLAAWPFITIPLIGTFVWGWWLALLMVTCLVLQDSWRRAAVPLAVTLAAAWLYALSGVPAALPIGPVNAGSYPGSPSVSAGILYTVAVGLVIGAAAAVRLATASSRRNAQAAASERRALEVESIATERARLARDLHDVVAHHVSLVAVRAESAPYAHPDLGEDARRVLAEIADDARAALGELRQVLTVLQRTEGGERAPQPTAGDVVGLVAQARAAGQDVTLTGRCEDVPDAEGYVLYRAAQEALTNARRHAPGAPVHVTLSHIADVVGLRVTNPVEGEVDLLPGRGLTGMRERVEALGGAMTVTVEDSSFVLVVTMPTAVDGSRSPALHETAGAA